MSSEPEKTLVVSIVDTTLRDGEQAHDVSFNPREKRHIAKILLSDVGVDRIEVASARVSSGEASAVREVTEWAVSAGCLDRVEILGFVDFGKSQEWIRDAGGMVFNLLVKGSEKHCHGQLNKSLSEHAADIEKTVSMALDSGLTVNVYLEDWSGGYLHSPDYVWGLMDRLKEMGFNRYFLPDTLGILDPIQVDASIREMVRRYPGLNFDFHPHNDYGLATANGLAAVKAGVRCLHTTVNCLGERAGNTALAEVVVGLRDLLGAKVSIDESELKNISSIVEEFSGKRLPDNAPIVGRDVFTQASGIHADGDKKGGLYENPIKPERFGRKRSYALGKMSGKASILKNLEILGLQLTEENQRKVLDRVVALGDQKRSIFPADLPFIITDVLGAGVEESVKLVNCAIASGYNLRSTATISLEVHGELHKAAGDGDGGYDAFMNALGKIYCELGRPLPVLVDYEIRIPKVVDSLFEEHGASGYGNNTSALTKAIITWMDPDGRRNKTVGVDTDQVIAGVRATMTKLNLEATKSSLASTLNNCS